MTKSYARLYPQILSHDPAVFSDPNSAPGTDQDTPWCRWRITETARRMVFLANMVNFFSNIDLTTGKQLAYYDPLDDDLILNMPLPCSQAEWSAQNEEDWQNAVHTRQLQEFPQSISSALDGTTREAIAGMTSLSAVFSQCSTDFLQTTLSSIGFGNSDALRALIILCACEQFRRT
jgi:hypothetical protein